jgi:TonB family protein
MESFAIYLLKSSVWLTGFALVYYIFLRNERFFRLKRVYLISGIIISFLFPLISINYQVEIPDPGINQGSYTTVGNKAYSIVQQEVIDKPFNYHIVLLSLYLSGIFLLSFRAAWYIRTLFKTINKAHISNRGPAKLIRALRFPASFSFFNYVFINPSVGEDEMEEIMNHEIVHVRQKHWVDLILIEILHLVQWINPFVWIYSGFIRLNHEYLADEAALQRTANPDNYKAALVNQLFSAPVFSLSNSFNYSLNKKRFNMMKKIITSPYRKVKILFILPVFAIVFYAFATPEYHYAASADNTMTIQKSPVIIVKNIRGMVLKEDGSPFKGVSILISGTNIGALTDNSGNFTIANVPEDAFIVFSYRGYLTQVLKAEFKSAMNIKMEKDPDYNEINVISYGDGTPVSGSVKIRNASDQSPVKALIVIDGVISNRQTLEGFNPNNIESVTVIKDKTATDKYGEKGKDGVIEITTRKGSPIIVVDDVISTKTRDEVMNEIGNQIATYKSLSVQEATEKYGEKGKYGAMEFITLKRAAELGIKVPFRRRNSDDYPTFQSKSYEYFLEWVAGQIKFPLEATAKGSHGYVHADFTIETDGTISNIKCTSAPDPLLGDAVIKAMQSSPKWEPAKNPEANEPFKWTATIKFELPDKVMIETQPFVVVEQMPVYPGGDSELLKFISENAHYPDSAKVKGIQGRVIVRFVINTKGKTEDVMVIKGVHPLLDAEAARVVNMLTGFKPGYQGGEPVPVWYMVPVTFTLQ